MLKNSRWTVSLKKNSRNISSSSSDFFTVLQRLKTKKINISLKIKEKKKIYFFFSFGKCKNLLINMLGHVVFILPIFLQCRT